MSDHEKMHEPVEVWLENTHKWKVIPCQPRHDQAGWFSGPHKIVPGMMNLDELASHGLMIQPLGDEGGPWGVFNPEEQVSDTYHTSIEAQWAATCLARKKDGKT